MTARMSARDSSEATRSISLLHQGKGARETMSTASQPIADLVGVLAARPGALEAAVS